MGVKFCDYKNALLNAKKGIAYISLPNSMHAEWVEIALHEGFHVIVDKPAFVNSNDSHRLQALAKAKGLCLSEATVWPYQSQILLAQEQIKFNNSNIRMIQASFSFPLLEPGNFRNSLDLGGGAFNDLGIYALSVGRVFFNEEPVKIVISDLSRNPLKEIDTAFSITAYYSDNRVFQGFFSFETEYKNSMRLLSSDIAIDIEPAFTSSANSNYIEIKKNNLIRKLKYLPNDGFSFYFKWVIDSIIKGDWQDCENIFSHDSKNFMRAKKEIAR